MKKILLSFVAAAFSLVVSAQTYVGGELGFWRDWQDGANKTSFVVNPEVGYNLNENWAIGVRLGYGYEYVKGDKVNAFEVSPYARYTYAKLGPVNLFLDGGFGFGTFKVKDADGNSSDAQNAWEVGIKPGLSVNLTEKLSFISHVGFFGYRKSDMGEVFGENGFGLKLKSTDLTFGLLYNF